MERAQTGIVLRAALAQLDILADDAHYEQLEFSYLRRLIATCIPALLVSYLLLVRMVSMPMLWQIGISIAGGLTVAAAAWFLFGVHSVLKKATGLFSSKFA